jgi:hypothetical protein
MVRAAAPVCGGVFVHEVMKNGFNDDVSQRGKAKTPPEAPFFLFPTIAFDLLNLSFIVPRNQLK